MKTAKAIQYQALPLAQRLIPNSQLVANLPYAQQIKNSQLSKNKKQIMKLIGAQMKQMPKKNYIQELQSPNYQFLESKFIKNEYERIKNQEKQKTINSLEYQSVNQPEQKDNFKDWEQKISQSQRNTIELQNRQLSMKQLLNRLLNLQLMKMYGEQKWQKRIRELQKYNEHIGRKNQDIQKQVDTLNKRRKFKQTNEIRPIIAKTTSQIKHQLNKNNKLQMECQQKEFQISIFRAKKKKISN